MIPMGHTSSQQCRVVWVCLKIGFPTELHVDMEHDDSPADLKCLTVRHAKQLEKKIKTWVMGIVTFPP